MQECTYEMRQAIENNFNQIFSTKLSALPNELAVFMAHIRSLNDYFYYNPYEKTSKTTSMNTSKPTEYDIIYKYLKSGCYSKPSDIFIDNITYNSSAESPTNSIISRVSQIMSKIHFPAKSPTDSTVSKTGISDHKQLLLDTFLSSDLKRDYLYIIDKLNQFQYSKGWNRRSVRTQSYLPQFSTIFSILWQFCSFTVYDCNLTDYLKNQISENLVSYKYSYAGRRSINYIIAAELDCGNTELESILEDIFLGENNVNVVSRDMISGILMSDNEKMHQLLANFLLAARLQEGVRQSICEAMDSGTPKAFYTLFKVVVDNNLIRFTAVKRAVATWIGICDTENLDRITQKIVDCMWECINSNAKIQEYLDCNDSIQLSVALWALGFTEIQNAISEAIRILQQKEKVKRLTAAFYIRSIGYEEYAFNTSKSTLELYNDDLELIACCISDYNSRITSIIADTIFPREYNHYNYNKTLRKPNRPKITDLFIDETEAKNHYDILWKLYNQIPKKEIVFFPCIFPWNTERISKNDILECLCIIAFILDDKEKLETLYDLIPKIDTYSRHTYVNFLLYNPTTPKQKDVAISLISDRESDTQRVATMLVENMDISKEHYQKLASMLKYKNSDVRGTILKLLYKQDDITLTECISQLMTSKKEEIRTGGLDLLLQLSKDKYRTNCYNSSKDLPKQIATPTSKEQILIEEICGDSESEKILHTKGYGLYNPDAVIKLPDISDKTTDKSAIFQTTLTKKQAYILLKKLDNLIIANATKEYTDFYGNERLLGDNSYSAFSMIMLSESANSYQTDCYPFPKMWYNFYESDIQNCNTLFQLWFFLNAKPENTGFGNFVKPYLADIFGKELLDIDLGGFQYASIIRKIINNLFLDFCKNPHLPQDNNIHTDDNKKLLELKKKGNLADNNRLWETSKLFISHIIKTVTKNKLYYIWKGKKYNEPHTFKQNIFEYPQISEFMQIICKWSLISSVSDSSDSKSKQTAISKELLELSNKRFIDSFILKYHIDTIYNFQRESENYYSNAYYLNIIDTVKAHTLKLVPIDFTYKCFFELMNKNNCLEELSLTVRDNIKEWELNRLKAFITSGSFDKNNEVFVLAKEIYLKIINVILKVELKRGDTETIFSQASVHIKYLSGTDRLVEILKALGKETLVRSNYYYGYDISKKHSLSHLLSVSYPNSNDTSDTLKKYLKGTDITEKRLVETALYAPQWMDIIDKYLGWPGFTSGCYYFIAHMNDNFDGKKEAIIAKYTPISIDNLKAGAFDIYWFNEAYKKLGDLRFNIIYNSAKYISNGIKHSRARKYADAALGKIDADKLAIEIESKRNKDSLMSYGIIPFKNKEKDLLSRYQFLQKFAKESKQFGAQRRASEKIAVQIAMENLAINAGFTDVTRLTLSMETKLIQSISHFLDWKEVAPDTFIKIYVSESGSSEIQYKKKEKMLKTLPASLKKDTYILELKNINKQLKEQYSRTRQMFEHAMEDGTIFYASEILALFENPVVKPIVENLLFIYDKKTDSEAILEKINSPDNMNNNSKQKLIGYLRQKAIINYQNDAASITANTPLRVAHCLDLYNAGHWQDFQKQVFDKGIKQPFKQIFRELYLKTEEEKEANHSLRYAGNQIQPQKTAACLKNRRWVADYEDGLQKIYYKENIVARIYALADWFSPSDIEAPTLEWVEFSDRKTYKSLKIADIPDLIYSEVMRDVDLAVSIAHAGGVDPETSHSTVEMRKAIIEFNLPLFKLTNVTFEGSHAIIEGTMAQYSLHLGSGIIHQIGSSQINVLPVHSQSRGKLFLPFIDEDPKTAEIISKVVLFAEDNKIKDPYILQQINRTNSRTL